jgi:peptidoglycan/xylan/chitin deacetylase (PgdA/CDA1 family)
VRKQRAQRRAAGMRVPIMVDAIANARWSLDFVHDQLAFASGLCRQSLATCDRLRNPDHLRRPHVAPPAPNGVKSGEALITRMKLQWQVRHKIGALLRREGPAASALTLGRSLKRLIEGAATIEERSATFSTAGSATPLTKKMGAKSTIPGSWIRSLCVLEDMLKRCLFLALGSGFVVGRRVSAINRRNRLTILNLHRVHRNSSGNYIGLDISLFSALVEFLAINFSLITFGEIDQVSKKPRLILSFDDGYKDFFEIVVPILAHYGVKANQNIIPECIETKMPPLNVICGDFIHQAPIQIIKYLNIPGFNNLSDDRLGFRLSVFIKNKPYIEQRRFADILLPQFFDWHGFRPTPMMGREEVKQVALIHEVGCHSYSHASMAHESNEYLAHDLVRCNQYFDELLGRSILIYAFPNGSYRSEQIEIVAESGVKHILLVGDDFADEKSPHRRFTFSANTLSEARFKALGGFRPV